MRVTVAILAKNEGENIGLTLAELARQTVFGRPDDFRLIIYVNASTDDTAARARAALNASFAHLPVQSEVIETPEGGKNLAWNTVVHHHADPATDLFIFCDADISFARADAVAELVAMLEEDQVARAVTGFMVKSIHRKSDKSLADRVSLRLSRDARLPHALNGSLYVIGGEEARKIWLPVPLPGEDGFLSAMVKTNGFTEPPVEERVISPAEPTHYYQAHTLAGFLRHEKRMTVGSTLSGWIYEDLWEQKLDTHAGELIRRRNAEDPQWIARLAQQRMGERSWVVPSRLLIGRLQHLRERSPVDAMKSLPLALAASALNLIPSVTANRELKSGQAAGFW